MSPEISKPSFAKVAANKPTADSLVPPTMPQSANDSNRPDPAPVVAGPVIANGGPRPRPGRALPSQPPSTNIPPSTGGTGPPVDAVAEKLDNLGIQPKSSTDPTISIDGPSVKVERPQTVSRESGASDESQRADSNSELGTKPPSLDGKSITSGTTFALDEKESLRPDDSASVKAAGEDDDTFSVRGSLMAGSRMSSELAVRSRGIQLGDAADRRLVQPTVENSGHGILTPQSNTSEHPPRDPAEMGPLPVDGSTDALNLIYQHGPDEKLIEAMGTPKDRMYLLRLEKDVIEFVQNSKEPFMDLPPSNSFCRMLAHKLADYYHMTHSFEPNIGVVRIFRTPFCRVPTSLAHWDPATDPSNNSTPPPVILPKKIMRRGQDGDGGRMSGSASKPTSDAGSDEKDKDKQGGQKLTREEREEMYKLARERIFGSSEENTNDPDKDNDMSRTSSVSGNKSSTAGKGRRGGRHRRDDSDSFDSRHHYAPYWGPQQQTWVPQYAQPPAGQPPAPQPPAYGGQVPPMYGQQNVAYPSVPGVAPSPGYPTYPAPQYHAQPPPARYPAGGSPMMSYGSPAPAAPQQPSTWQPGFGSPAHQGRGLSPSNPPMHPGIPYAFGQLPANANPHDLKSQHPIPGSYNRNHNFNPMTQSFVPGSNGMPAGPGPQPPFTAPTSHHGSPQIGSVPPAYPGYQPGMPQPYGGGHGMVRQASNNSVPGYHHPPPHMPPVYAHHPPPPNVAPQSHQPPPLQQANPAQAAHIPSRPPVPSQGHNHVFSHLPTYGNPATLPQKPATGF